ncbi:MAG TPA: hypothetical protein PLD43_00760 [Anaerolineae bacterium]|nr:hypothetical protein [Anaerolineae bacterium]
MPPSKIEISESAVSESAKKRKGEKSLMWQRVRELQAALRPLFSFLDGVRQHMASPSKIEISESAVSESAKKREKSLAWQM